MSDKEEKEPLESCPKCLRYYSDEDFDDQICSHCGWDADTNTYIAEEE
jgi:hypothetical protein